MASKPPFVGEKSSCSLGDVALVKAGNVAPKSQCFSDSGIPFVRAGSLAALLAGNPISSLEKIVPGVAQDLGMRLFPKGTVLFAKSGMSCMTGNVYRLPEPCYVVSHLACVMTEDELLSQWLLHYFRYNKPSSLIENPSFPSIKLSKLSSIKVILPDRNEMLSEVQALSAIEKQNELCKAQIKKLDQLIKSRFVEMFGDPGVNPLDYPIEKLENLGSLARGKSKHRPRNAPELRGGPDGPYPLIQTGDIANAGTYLDSYGDTYTDLGLQQSQMWPKGTLCITIAANIAKTSILSINACFPDSVVGFMAGERISNLFMHYWFSFFQSILEKQAPQAAQKNINLKILQNLGVIVPPLELQQQFADFVAQVDKSRFVVLYARLVLLQSNKTNTQPDNRQCLRTKGFC